MPALLHLCACGAGPPHRPPSSVAQNMTRQPEGALPLGLPVCSSVEAAWSAAVQDNIDVAGLATTAACRDFEYVPTQHARTVQALLNAGKACGHRHTNGGRRISMHVYSSRRLDAYALLMQQPARPAAPSAEGRVPSPLATPPSPDAPVLAGGICLGKTNMDQFACGLVGTRTPYGVPGMWARLQAGMVSCRVGLAGARVRPWRRPVGLPQSRLLLGHMLAPQPSISRPPARAANAFDDRFTPGGSSCGSAVAVAEGLCTFALGTDTAGSGGCSSPRPRCVKARDESIRARSLLAMRLHTCQHMCSSRRVDQQPS